MINRRGSLSFWYSVCSHFPYTLLITVVNVQTLWQLKTVVMLVMLKFGISFFAVY